MSELECKESNGQLFITAGDRSFVVTPHQGKDAIRTRRQVKKLFMPQVAEIAEIRQRAFSKLSKDEKEHYRDLVDQVESLEDGSKEIRSKLEKELEDMLSKHEDPGAIAKSSANISALMDLDQEELLDALVFKNTKAKVGTGNEGFKPLNDDVTFDIVFAGKNGRLGEMVRDKIIQFNGFLDQ